MRPRAQSAASCPRPVDAIVAVSAGSTTATDGSVRLLATRLATSAGHIGTRRKTGWADEVRREAAAVQAALDSELAELGLSVSPIICVHRAELPWFGSKVDGIPIVSGRRLVRKLRQSKPVLPPERVKLLADVADARLKSALRAADSHELGGSHER
jgi:hypothetical protein